MCGLNWFAFLIERPKHFAKVHEDLQRQRIKTSHLNFVTSDGWGCQWHGGGQP